MEVTSQHTVMFEPKKKATANQSDNTVKNLIWLLLDTSLLACGKKMAAPYSLKTNKTACSDQHQQPLV
eukprot:7813582-Pyramimonas_sp.AAC.1